MSNSFLQRYNTKILRCQLAAASASAAATAFYGKTVGIAAGATGKRDDLRAGTAGCALVGKFDGILAAFGAETAVDTLQLLFFLFEIVDIYRDGTGEDDQQKCEKIGIDCSLLIGWYRF